MTHSSNDEHPNCKRVVLVCSVLSDKEAICDVLSESRFRLRVVAQGSNLPFTMHRTKESDPYVLTSSNLELKTIGQPYDAE